MAEADLLSVTIAFHGATLVPLGVALQKFGDRSEMFQKSLAGVGEAMERLRRRVATELEEAVASAFPQPGAVAQAGPILDAAGNHITGFVQQPVPFPASEAFRNCIHEYARRNESALRAYAELVQARDGWTRWAKAISWCVLALLAWELIAFGTTGVVCGLLKITLPRWALLSSYAPTGVLVVLFLLAFGSLLRNHDEILDIRRSNDAL